MKRIIGRVARIHPASLEEAELLTDQAVSEIYELFGHTALRYQNLTRGTDVVFNYGMFSFKKYGVGPLKCVEVATGAVKWEKPGFGAGNVILAGDKVSLEMSAYGLTKARITFRHIEGRTPAAPRVRHR